MRKEDFYNALVKHLMSSETVLAGLKGERPSLKLCSSLNGSVQEPQALFIFKDYFYLKIPNSCNPLLL